MKNEKKAADEMKSESRRKTRTHEKKNKSKFKSPQTHLLKQKFDERAF